MSTYGPDQVKHGQINVGQVKTTQKQGQINVGQVKTTQKHEQMNVGQVKNRQPISNCLS